MWIQIKKRCKLVRFSIATSVVLLFIATCGAKTNGETKKLAPTAIPIGTEVSLTFTGYNYTDRYIDDFSVNSISGGNLFVSNSINGGGGSTCCIGYITGVKKWKIPIRFHIGSCTYDTQHDLTGKLFSRTHNFYKSVEVTVDPNIPARPYFFEVHIYPDNHIEAVVTESTSPARLSLSRNREDKSPYKQCPNDKRPEE